MLELNLHRVFALRGVNNPFTTMVKLGISRPTATNLLNNNVSSIKCKHLEKICEFLNCEPNDLYEWKPSKNTPNAENHPLRNLQRLDNPNEISQTLRLIPLDKLNQIKTLLIEKENS